MLKGFVTILVCVPSHITQVTEILASIVQLRVKRVIYPSSLSSSFFFNLVNVKYTYRIRGKTQNRWIIYTGSELMHERNSGTTFPGAFTSLFDECSFASYIDDYVLFLVYYNEIKAPNPHSHHHHQRFVPIILGQLDEFRFFFKFHVRVVTKFYAGY